jgi:hypothetical protein
MKKDKSQLDQIEKYKKLQLPSIKETTAQYKKETHEDRFLNNANASPRKVGKDVMKRQYLNSVLKQGKRNSSYGLE